MKIEHLALQVAEPKAMAAWYVVQLGMSIERTNDDPVAFFMADESGQIMLEIYLQTDFEVPDYASIQPAHLHLAFLSNKIEADYQRLLAAGATSVSPVETLGDGDQVAMLRDPWGLPLQLVTRAEPMLR
ncbi:MAG: VOC family protein [Pirellulales bacterium]|jgi:glyoxylase I family protein